MWNFWEIAIPEKIGVCATISKTANHWTNMFSGGANFSEVSHRTIYQSVRWCVWWCNSKCIKWSTLWLYCTLDLEYNLSKYWHFVSCTLMRFKTLRLFLVASPKKIYFEHLCWIRVICRKESKRLEIYNNSLLLRNVITNFERKTLNLLLFKENIFNTYV